MFSVGVLIHPSKDDERFEELEDAEEAAIKASIDDDVWGVWEDDGGELQSIAYQCQIFSA